MNAEKIREIFHKANFVNDLGIVLGAIGSGKCETSLKILPKHLQQTQVVHAGVIATLADHTAGGAASSLLQENEYILTVDFKISLLRASTGESLHCISTVIKQGKKLSFTEAEVYDILSDGSRKLVAKASVILAVLEKTSS